MSDGLINDPYTRNTIQQGVHSLVHATHDASFRGGWYHDEETGQLKKRNLAEMIALIHSELSEALEGIRKDLMDEHLPHRKSVEVELADAMIRIGDLAGYLELDVAGAILEKMDYNEVRADHKRENRVKAGGKKF